MSLRIRTSNRLEHLVDALADDLAREPLSPLENETILVPGQGIARWIRMELARRHRISASLEMPFPSAFLDGLCAALLPGEPQAPLTGEPLALCIHRLLGREDLELGPARDYCRVDPDGSRRWQLAHRLASAFESYRLFREDLLLSFAANGAGDGEHGPWQAALWRALLADAGHPRQAHRFAFLRDALADEKRAASALPRRVFVFGIASLPFGLLSLLAAIARIRTVTLYAPKPSPHYFGDLRVAGDGGSSSLLKSFAEESRVFFDQLVDLGVEDSPEDFLGDADPEPREPATLLEALQRDIFCVRRRGRRGEDLPLELPAGDDSLTVHDCHSPMREMEVLRDRLLLAMERDPALRPSDVLVLIPDIETYAPFVHAAFAPVQDLLPYRVADRSPAADRPAVALVLRILSSASTRVTSRDISGLLEDPLLLGAFDLYPADLPAIRSWIDRAAIRWGIDTEHRRSFADMPEVRAGTWEEGIDRLLFGFAAGPGCELVSGILPAADRTAARANVLARFAALAGWLLERIRAARVPLPIRAWCALCQSIADDLFRLASDQDGASLLREALVAARRHAETARSTEPIPLSSWLDLLQRELASLGARTGFLTGAVTFAALRPLRLVPARVVAIAGLSADAFPRRDGTIAFDLLRHQKRRGDPDRRAADRQLFLDAILAARERMILTFVGRSRSDGSLIAPSVVLEELLDHIDQAFRFAGREGPARRNIVILHPPQAFSRRYRDGSDARLVTYAPLVRSRPLSIPAEARPERPVPDEDRRIDLGDLADFWTSPARDFCRTAVGLRLPERDPDFPEREAFEEDHRTLFRIREELVQRLLAGDTAEHLIESLAASGRFPPLALGERKIAEVVLEASDLAARVQRAGELARRRIRLRLQCCELVGALDGLAAGKTVFWRPGRIRTSGRPKVSFALGAWVRHVAASATAPHCAVSHWIGADEEILVAPPAAPLEVLENLAKGYLSGRRRLLPFLASFSLEFAVRSRKGTPAPKILASLRREFSGSFGAVGDEADGGRLPSLPGALRLNRYERLAFRDIDPFGEEFCVLARAVFDPLLDALEPREGRRG
ncbi:MAG: exodeoxyribonuclease V subunit gamma [Planctomycetota bacterium]